jgi:6-phosphogluconolactonase/glucosamine-6-phosphate isomerase/deaminase
MEIIRKKQDLLDSFLLDEIVKAKAAGVEDILIPAGGTPESFYKALVNSNDLSLKSLNLWQIDEIISGPKAGIFKRFFYDHLGPFKKQLIEIENINSPPVAPYYSFLGLGINGHVAFHEPHIPHDFSLGCVSLGEETLHYLNLNEKTWGLTFGLKTFLNSERIFLMVKGSHKSEILKRFLEDDPSVPAVKLKKHKNLTLLLDDQVAFQNESKTKNFLEQKHPA